MLLGRPPPNGSECGRNGRGALSCQSSHCLAEKPYGPLLLREAWFWLIPKLEAIDVLHHDVLAQDAFQHHCCRLPSFVIGKRRQTVSVEEHLTKAIGMDQKNKRP